MRWTIPLLAFLSLGLGCSGDQSIEEPTTGSSARFGLIAVSYGHDWNESGEGMLLTTTAQFVRYAAMNQEQIARLLALPLDPDRDLPPLERCRLYDLGEDLTADVAKEPEEQGNVELLEAGNLEIQTQGRTVTLAPKHFPGLLPFISGVIYSEAQTTLIAEPGKVSATSSGGEAVGPFSAQVLSPSLPQIQQIGEQAPTTPALLPRDRDLSLRWLAQEGIATDVTYLELRFHRAKQEMALRCHVRDDGQFEVPQAQLAEVAGKATLEIARLRRTFSSAVGLDRIELRVTVRDAATLP